MGWGWRRGVGRGEGVRARVGGGLAGEGHRVVQAGQGGGQFGSGKRGLMQKWDAARSVGPSSGLGIIIILVVDYKIR